MEDNVKKVLCVGLSCLDIVMFCESYPLEDSDQRCLRHKWQRGGNASNNSTVFTEFNIPCEVLATLSNDIGGQFMKEDFKKHNILIENCPFYNEYESPTSTIWINSCNGSRTIVHSNKNMPEVSIEDFKQLNLNNYRWIHFECRPKFEAIKAMIQHVRSWNEDNSHNCITISIEIEKPRLGCMEMVAEGDFVFVSKDFAMACGYKDMVTAVQSLYRQLRPGGVIICAWGEKGASAKDGNAQLHTSDAFSPKNLVNTLGAGDTFVAATIMAQLKGMGIRESIEIGCKVAGEKCGMHDTVGLAKLFPCLLY